MQRRQKLYHNSGKYPHRPGAGIGNGLVWHKFRLLYPHRTIQTLALFAKPRRVLEYVNCLTFFAMSAQSTPAYPSLTSFAQPPRMFPVRGSVRYDYVSSFAGASQNGKQLPYSKTRVRVCKIMSLTISAKLQRCGFTRSHLSCGKSSAEQPHGSRVRSPSSTTTQNDALHGL